MRKVITLITWSDLYLMRPTGASDWPGGREVSRPRSPAAGCRDDIEDKDAVVEGGEVGEHRDPRLPGIYISRGFSYFEKKGVWFIQQLSCTDLRSGNMSSFTQ